MFLIPKELLKSQGNYFSTFQKHSAYPPKKLLVYLYPTEPNAPKNTYLKYVTVTHQRMKSPQVHHKVTVKTKRFRVQWFGQKISMLFFRRYVFNLEHHFSETLSKEVMADINALTVGSSHRVVRQVYAPLLSSFTVVYPTSRSGKMKLHA